MGLVFKWLNWFKNRNALRSRAQMGSGFKLFKGSNRSKTLIVLRFKSSNWRGAQIGSSFNWFKDLNDSRRKLFRGSNA